MRASLIPKEYEDSVYQLWLDSGVMDSSVDHDKEPFVIVMPPPNITGQLHMGHALNNSLQDCIIRHKRMQGYNTLWIPGTDHASIATELKIVEQLKLNGQTKQSVGREGFLELAYAWKDKYGKKIIEQLKKLGISCDWSRLSFTMDNNLTNAVRYTFVKMYNDGLIEQGNKIINWCCDCKTAISDAEVEYSTIDGSMWHIKYPFSDGSGYIVVATTRPETMLGDTAVAVNPKDDRYSAFVGKTLKLPLTDRLIPIIADDYVDKSFGSGAVKITPAHDPNDFIVGTRHNLPIIKILDDNGLINCNPYLGLSVAKAREAVERDLTQAGLLVRVEKHTHNVGHCYRCHTVVEPLVSKQWFVKMATLAKPAIEVVKKNKTEFLPKSYSKIYMHWLKNIKDWCISRQLWWGHRIPAYYCNECNGVTVEVDATICKHCKSADIKQDEAVLDTWFSSALWPFSTLGYPNVTEDLKYYYPTSVLVTAYDIIFFWVARMVFSGLYHMGQTPFKKVIMHGIVRDENGIKMSKSLGNGIDPLQIIEEYGADSLRYSLISGVAYGSDIRYSKSKLEGSQNFCNKLFNAAKFVINNATNNNIKIIDITKCSLSISDKWILTHLSMAAKNTNKQLDKYETGKAAAILYNFVWSDFCDWFIELSKVDLYSDDKLKMQNKISILFYVLDNILKLLHPILPFLTEDIWQSMQDLLSVESSSNKAKKVLALQQYPVKIKQYKKDSEIFDKVVELIQKIRATKKELNVPINKKPDLYVLENDLIDSIKKNQSIIKKLGGIDNIYYGDYLKKASTLLTSSFTCKIPYDGMIDIQEELARLEKELNTAKAEKIRAESKLNNQGFVAKAPKELLELEKQKLCDYNNKIEKIMQQIKLITV